MAALDWVIVAKSSKPLHAENTRHAVRTVNSEPSEQSEHTLVTELSGNSQSTENTKSTVNNQGTANNQGTDHPEGSSNAENTADCAVVFSSVTKSFGTRRAVDSLSFTVKKGEVFALLGPNGAGKTTTIEMCEGFSEPDSGSITLLGLDPSRQTDEVRSRIGIMLQGGGAYPGVKVEEMLSLLASYSSNPLDVGWLLQLVGLTGHRRTSYRRLSGGQQQRLSLACALVGRPELVFLDEPTAGMDAQSRLAVWELINALKADGVTVVLTTHLMDEAEALADSVLIIDHGRVVASGTTTELTSSQDARLTLTTSSSIDIERANSWLSDQHRESASGNALSLSALRPHHYRLEGPANPDTIQLVTRLAADQSVLITSLDVDHRSLEDVFLDITGREMRD